MHRRVHYVSGGILADQIATAGTRLPWARRIAATTSTTASIAATATESHLDRREGELARPRPGRGRGCGNSTAGTFDGALRRRRSCLVSVRRFPPPRVAKSRSSPSPGTTTRPLGGAWTTTACRWRPASGRRVFTSAIRTSTSSITPPVNKPTVNGRPRLRNSKPSRKEGWHCPMARPATCTPSSANWHPVPSRLGLRAAS